MHRQLGFLSPRSIAILVVLLIVLVVPLWWLSGSAKKQEAQLAAEKAAAGAPATAPTTAAAPAAVNNPDAYGMTWGILPSEKLPASAVWMSCHGSPKEGISQPHADSCNPYKGDASCRLALPVLCIKKDGSTPESALGQTAGTSAEPLKEQRDKGAITLHDVVTDGWAAGSVASTEPVAGFVLGSLEGANARCEKELGSGWRMASFHDGSGGNQSGWGFVAQRSARLETRWRHWVYIRDQPGNCWNNK
ncbi:MAG: hypothetical protein ACKO1L_14140 [Brachymonas sp.]